MTDFPVPDDERLNEFRASFSAFSATRELMEKGAHGSSETVSARKLYAYAAGMAAYPNARLEAMLRTHPGMRVAYRRMMNAAATYSLGTAMAASDGDLLPRSGEGCSIRFEKSQAEKGLYYVIIELQDATQGAGYLGLCDAENNCRQFSLPGARRGIIQFLTDEDSDILNLLRDPNTEVLLR